LSIGVAAKWLQVSSLPFAYALPLMQIAALVRFRTGAEATSFEISFSALAIQLSYKCEACRYNKRYFFDRHNFSPSNVAVQIIKFCIYAAFHACY
jgi:hypothetical protein